MRVLVTGANGFVGRELCRYLLERNDRVRGAVRKSGTSLFPGVEPAVVGEIGGDTDWTSALRGMEAVVHLAARVHVMRDAEVNPLKVYRAVNTHGALNLARQAAQSGVKRFIYLSTIKVNGEGRASPYVEADSPDPIDPYAVSKLEAEHGLHRIARETGMEVVILRPPLVYGPGVRANFLRLMETVRKGWPLPLGAIRNRRSLLYLGNLVDAIRVCIEHPAAAGQTFLLDDGRPVSTPELIRAVAHAMGRPAHLVAVPVGMLEFAGALLGRRAAVTRLTGSLWVDSALIRSRLGWTPPYSMAEGLAETVASSK